MVGGPALLESINVHIPNELSERVRDAGRYGQTIIFVIRDKKMLGAITLADIIRAESREAIRSLKEMGVKSAMITGDSEDVAKWVASELDIDEYFARVLPSEKSEKVKTLQGRSLKVAMVGDGINDAPALTQADLGIAIGAGTNVAIESAGIILVRNDPRDIVKIIRLSQITYAKMVQNLFWATGYNVVALPLAAGALAFKGIILQPALAAVFMSASTVIVAVNAMLLRRKNI
jgi:Cu2+-exporting ATPase